MATITELTGQAELLSQFEALLAGNTHAVVAVSGPSGVGKSWLANQVVRNWKDSGKAAFIAIGDEMCKARPRYPLLLAMSSATEKVQAQARRRVVSETVAAVPGVGKPIRDLLNMLSEQEQVQAAAQAIFLNDSDIQLLLRMKHAAAERQVLLVCDNIQWWDSASIEWLRLLCAERTKEVFPFLQDIVLLIVETTTPGRAPDTLLDRLAPAFVAHRYELARIKEVHFSELLQAFGHTRQLPANTVHQLFSACGGHLELVRRIVESTRRDPAHANLDDAASATDFLADLIERNLSATHSLSLPAIDLLRTASIIGRSFLDEELACLTKRPPGEIQTLLAAAEEQNIVVRQGTLLTFVHDLIRSYFFDRGQLHHKALHQQFVNCLAVMQPGDYARRAAHLTWAGATRAAAEMDLLAKLVELRKGHTAPIEEFVALGIHHCGDFARSLLEAHRQFSIGFYDGAVETLNQMEDLCGTALLAERDILLARCHIKLLTLKDRQMARSILAAWEDQLGDEFEIWGRLMIYRVVAEVFLGDETAARKLGKKLERRLAPRLDFDTIAYRTIHHLRLKGSMLMPPTVMRVRLQETIAYFNGEGPAASYDPVHLYIAYTSLSACQLNDGKFSHAREAAEKAMALQLAEPEVKFPRRDIPLNNYALSGYLGQVLSLDDALAVFERICVDGHTSNDDVLLLTNRAALLADCGRFEDARNLLAPAYTQIGRAKEIDPYYTYFVGNNLCGSLYMLGKRRESRQVWREITPFAAQFTGAMRSYMEVRHARLGEIFKRKEKQDWRTVLVTQGPPAIGPGWQFYGRGFIVSDLEFWSDE